ncbi:MAG: hypothetical protein MUE32_05500, partial [Bacteroidales bacterium]|nr:hypothetical protein [Bacteroidales bacterium]
GAAMDGGNADKAKMKVLTATLETEGFALIGSGSIITIQNVGERHKGNWWVETVEHNISKNGYITTFSLLRNAAHSAT